LACKLLYRLYVLKLAVFNAEGDLTVKMHKTLKIAFAAIAMAIAYALASTADSSAAAYDELSPAELQKIQKGDQVVHLQDVDGSVWPKITVYQRAEATPEELTAVFHDYSMHKQIFDRITRSTVSRVIDPATVEVDYTLSLGGIPGFSLPDENYTTRDHVAISTPGSYRVDWAKVKADNIPNIEGLYRAEPLGTGSIIAYYNFIVPYNPGLAKFIVKLAIKQVRDTVSALAAQTLKERNTQPDLLQRQLTDLRTALGQ
jgi:hypothetical protein